MPKLVMIVDDNEDIVNTLKIIVEKEGHQTDIAFNGQELLDKLKTVKPDLILLDVMMPGLTTKQILSELGKDKKRTNLKIMLVTVVRFAKDEEKALLKNKSIVDYVIKPFDIHDLVQRIKKQL